MSGTVHLGITQVTITLLTPITRIMSLILITAIIPMIRTTLMRLGDTITGMTVEAITIRKIKRTGAVTIEGGMTGDGMIVMSETTAVIVGTGVAVIAPGAVILRVEEGAIAGELLNQIYIKYAMVGAPLDSNQVPSRAVRVLSQSFQTVVQQHWLTVTTGFRTGALV